MRDVLEVVQGNRDPTLTVNSARIATFLRPASENMHTLKLTYKHIGNKCHNSRLVATGPRTIDHYNRVYGRNYGPEWKETPTLMVEYLVIGGRYNQNHPKLFR